MTERKRNNLRFDRLPEYKKLILNEIAIAQFKKHHYERLNPTDILDIIDFSQPQIND